jgi:hypothetical protein
MPSRRYRCLVALLVFCVMYAGPVAACVCAMDSMNAMPCCPDQGPDASDCAQPDSQVSATCDPISADALPSVPLDLVAPPMLVVSLALSDYGGPPTVPIPAQQQKKNDTPVYLATLRLRV